MSILYYRKYEYVKNRSEINDGGKKVHMIETEQRKKTLYRNANYRYYYVSGEISINYVIFYYSYVFFSLNLYHRKIRTFSWNNWQRHFRYIY